MCGIVAAIRVRTSDEKKSAALNSLAHRGPDASGQWVSGDGEVWLGHRRLSIVDLSEAGNQPMTNENGTIFLVLNGEIYNYPDLKKRLEALGHRFSSACDSEAVIHAYEQWGVNCLEHLDGMFSFALWDEKQKQLFAARDRVGIKPLYFSRSGNGLVLASEARAVRCLLLDSPEVDPTALAYVMTLGYVPSPWSIWKGISKLDPGHYLLVKPGATLSCHRYWEPPRALDHAENRTQKQWAPLFETVVVDHLLADVPIALFLSGGLDSTALAVALSEKKSETQALTVSFPGNKNDESPVAACVARHLGTPHRTVPLSVDDVDGLIDKTVAAYDEPQGYSALLSMFLISAVAARDFKVVLAGDGGDEVFGGYNWYKNLSGTTPSLASRLLTLAGAAMDRGPGSALAQFNAQRFAAKSALHRHAQNVYPRFLPKEANAILRPTGIHFDEDRMLAPLLAHYEPTLPLKRALQRIDLMTFCTDSILAKVDRASMAHSLEVRVPFLDHRIVEWGLSKPISHAANSAAKPTLREYLGPRIPADVLAHPKQGFSLPILASYNWDRAMEEVKNSQWVKMGIWEKGLDKLLAPTVKYDKGRLWNLLVLSRWGDAWLGGDST